MIDKKTDSKTKEIKIAEEDIRIAERLKDEEVEKLKDEKEAFLYFSAALTDVRIAKAEEEYIETLKKYSKKTDNPKQQAFVKDCEKALELFTIAEYAREKKNAFFSIDNHPDKELIQKSLKAVNMTENQFATVAFVSCKDNMKKVAEFISKPADKVNPNEAAEINKIRDDAVLEARNQLYNYVKYGPEIFAKVLAGGLRVSCEAFAMEKDPRIAVQWSMYTEEILNTLKSNPALMKAAELNENQIHIADESASMGKNIKGGLKSLEMLSSFDNKNTKLDQVSKRLYSDSLIRMQQAISAKKSKIKNWDEPVAEKDANQKSPLVTGD